MSIFKKREKIVVTCPKYMAVYLRREILWLGFEIRDEGDTFIETIGTLEDCIKLNLNIRTGNNVLFEVKSFQAMNAEELYDNLVQIPWETMIDEKGYICITSNVKNPFIDNTMFANVKTKDAIVDRMVKECGVRPDSGSMRDRTVIHLHWVEDEATIFLDTSGETLSKHGYRLHPGLAPMQENLAAAVVMATGWNGEGNFINPMCGSGTLAIEAALIALKKPMGLFRSYYGFMYIKDYDEAVYKAELQYAVDKSLTEIRGRIIATDINSVAVELSKKNAKEAGVEKYIEFKVGDFRQTTIPEEGKGVIIFNPEYGERLGEFEELEIIYKEIGNFMKQSCGGYDGFVFTGSPDLAKCIGLKAARRIEFFNSKIECRLLKFELYQGTKRTTFKRVDTDTEMETE